MQTYKIYVVGVLMALSFWAGYKSAPDPKERIKTVTQVQERQRVVTRIKEHADGTKETVITDDRVKESENVMTKTESAPKWSLGLYTGLSRDFKVSPIYTLTLQRKVLGELSVGLYGRSDGELGIGLGYSF